MEEARMHGDSRRGIPTATVEANASGASIEDARSCPQATPSLPSTSVAGGMCGCFTRIGVPRSDLRSLDLFSQSPACACASWRSQDIVCPGVSPGGSNGTDSRQVPNSAALPRRCVAVAPRRRGSAALPATSRVRSVQEPGSASPCMLATGDRTRGSIHGSEIWDPKHGIRDMGSEAAPSRVSGHTSTKMSAQPLD